MKKRWLFLLFIIVSPAYSETIYEVSDLVNIAKRSGNLLEKFYRESFINPEADEEDYGMNLQHILKDFYNQEKASQYIPKIKLNMSGTVIDNFPVTTAGGVYNCSLKQGFASLLIKSLPIIISEDKETILSIDFSFLGHYTGIKHSFNIEGFSPIQDATGVDNIGTELRDNLYGMIFKTPWINSHIGFIQNKIFTNVHLSSEGVEETYRFFFGGNIFEIFNSEFQICSNVLEYYDLAINCKKIMDLFSIKIPFHLNFITGIIDYNYFYYIKDNLRSLTSGDFRFYLNPQIGYAPYIMATSYLEWQPEIENLNINHLRCANAELKLTLPIYFYLMGNGIKLSAIKNPNTNNLPIVIFEIGINGGISYYSDTALLNYDAPSTSANGYYYALQTKFNWTAFSLKIEYCYRYNYQKSLMEYIESYNKPLHELKIKVEL